MMENKKRDKSFLKDITVILISVFISSCSVVGQWWYDRIDIYIANYFFEYAEFSNEQKSYIRKITKEFGNWNSNFELPKYMNLLVEVKDLDHKTTFKDVEKILGTGRTLFQESNNFFTPYIVIFCKDLTDKQVDEISFKFKERIDKRETSLKESKNKNPISSSLESFGRLARFLGVKLTKAQKNELRKLYETVEDSRNESIENQKAWNMKLISILKSRKKRGDFNSELKIHLDSLLDLEEDYEKQRVYNEMIAVTISSLNEKQKDKFQGRLNTFIKSIDKIIKSQQ